MRNDREASRATREALDLLLFCENLSAQSHEYLMERPSLERMAESVQRIEETMTDRMEEPIAPLGAAVAVGPALDVRAFRGDEAGRPRRRRPAAGRAGRRNEGPAPQAAGAGAAPGMELPAARGGQAAAAGTALIADSPAGRPATRRLALS